MKRRYTFEPLREEDFKRISNDIRTSKLEATKPVLVPETIWRNIFPDSPLLTKNRSEDAMKELKMKSPFQIILERAVLSLVKAMADESLPPHDHTELMRILKKLASTRHLERNDDDDE